MARTITHTKLETPTARARLKKGRQAHWQQLKPGVHIGYQRWPGDAEGHWLLRRYLGGGNTYRTVTVGAADDHRKADGINVLDYEQAKAKIASSILLPGLEKVHRLTVRQAMDRYVTYKRSLGQNRAVRDVLSRGTVHILPTLGDLVIEELDADKLRRWLATVAHTPAQLRSKAGKPQYRPALKTEEDKRKRKVSANRVLIMLKAILNHAYDEGMVANKSAWDRRLKPFRNVGTARARYLTVAEAQRLVNACDPDFRDLVRKALETGCRYSELARLQVHDFNADAGTVTVGKSKTGKPRHVVLTDQGAAFFKQHCAGRGGHDFMFIKADDSEWKESHQEKPMRRANERARLKPPIGFHGLRHTWASLAVMGGVPLMVVAKNLGHSDTGMVEHHYGHLAPSYITDAIRAGAPRFNIKDKTVVVPLK
jgi:integrase